MKSKQKRDRSPALSQASLEYLTEIDPSETWNRRGLNGHKMSREETIAWHEQKQERLKERVRSGNYRRRIRKFTNMVRRIYQDLRKEPRQVIKEYFPDTTFIFIIGMARTGGTYLLNGLCEILEEDLKNYTLRMIHDGIPTFDSLVFQDNNHGKGRFYFQWAEYLAWAKLEMSHLNVIPKKRISFGHSLPFIDRCFGSRAKYVLTIRDPSKLASSLVEMNGLKRNGTDETQKKWCRYLRDRSVVTEDTWNNLNFPQRLFTFWKSYYLEIIHSLPLAGPNRVLSFGEDYPDFLNKFAERMNVDFSPGDFSSRKRIKHNWWETADVSRDINEIKRGLEKKSDHSL